jgi:outer membrane protein
MQMMKELKNVGLLTVCCLALSFAAGPCFAAATSGDSPWMVRVRALGIFPDVSSTQITTIGGEADIDDAYTLDLDISYFFTENIALELTLAYAQHDVSANNTILGTVNLGSLDILPPTLTLQYHFMPKNAFRPYIGAGVSYVLIPNYDAGPVATSIDYENGKFGAAIQFGFDYFFNKNWCLNVDVKKVWVSVDATVYALNTAVYTSVDVDPWLIGVGIGYRF